MRKVRGGSIPPAQPWELISLDCLRESRICLLGVGLPNDSQDCFWNYRIIWDKREVFGLPQIPLTRNFSYPLIMCPFADGSQIVGFHKSCVLALSSLRRLMGVRTTGRNEAPQAVTSRVAKSYQRLGSQADCVYRPPSSGWKAHNFT
jgi:hypothetical protein